MISNESLEPQILKYGPHRLIGISRVCKSSDDCKDLWSGEDGFAVRAKEIESQAGEIPYYALCRCIQGAEPGAFEYIAAMPAANDVKVPSGMAEFIVPDNTYAAFPVAGLHEIGQVWGYTGEWFKAHPEWQSFCDGNPEGCGCIANPSFELYPPNFDGTGNLFIYIPVKPAL